MVRKMRWARHTRHLNFSTNGKRLRMRTKQERDLIHFVHLFAEHFLWNAYWRYYGTMFIFPILQKKMTRLKSYAVIRSSLLHANCETISWIICVLSEVMVRAVPISEPQGVGKLIPCCSLPANWLCDARSSWAVLLFSSSWIGKIWKHKVENCSAAQNNILKTKR